MGAAEGPVSCFIGLMGRRGLEPDQGLYFPRCSSIHMFFMRFAIDAVYVKAGAVEKIVHRLKPWRISWCPGADGVLEAPAGWARRVGLEEGRRVRFEEASEARP